MVAVPALAALALGVASVRAQCPYMAGELPAQDPPASHPQVRRDDSDPTAKFLSQFELDDNGATLTSDVGGPFSDQNSLSAGERGPTLLEDFIFRQKVCHKAICKFFPF